MGFNMNMTNSSDFTINGGYTGSAPNTSLLTGADMLNVGARGTITVSLKVTPGANLGRYTATATGRSPAEATVMDNSHDEARTRSR